MAMTTQHTHNAHHHEHSAGSDSAMTGLLEPDDQATLTALLAALLADQGPGPVSDPVQLHIRGIRTVTLARRAAA